MINDKMRYFINKYPEIFSIIGITIAIKAVLLVILALVGNIIPFNQFGPEVNFSYIKSSWPALNPMGNWDGQRYLYIAENGYGINDGDLLGISKFVLYPTYPYLMKIVSLLLGGNLFISGIVISFIASLGLSLFLYKLIRLDYNDEIARKSIVLFLIFPATIFYVAIYNEALFLAIALSSFYFARTKRWIAASVLAGLAAFTKPHGILLLIPLIIELYLQYREESFKKAKIALRLRKYAINTISLGLIPIGYLLVIYHSFKFGQATNLYFEAVSYFGAKQFSLLHIPGLIFTHVMNLVDLPAHGYMFSRLNISLLLLYIALLVPIRKHLRLSYFTYALLIVFVPLSSGIMSATIRALSLSFPHFIYLGYLSHRSYAIDAVLKFTFSILTGIIGLLFINWYWAG